MPFLLQPLDPDVEPRQSDVVVKIEGISDLFVDVLTRGGDLFIARLGGIRDLLPQIVNFRRILRALGGDQEKTAGMMRWTPNVRQPEPCLKVYPYRFRFRLRSR